MNAERAAERSALREPAWVRVSLIAISLLFLAGFLVVPLVAVFGEALRKGFDAYLEAVRDPDALAAVRLTLLATAIAVPCNVVFGLAAAWCLARYDFKGRTALITLVDLPFAVSPVVAGLVFVLVFGKQGWFGGWLADHGVQVIFGTPGIVLATIFVTVPFVARELLPLLQQQGEDEELAALTLGASGWRTFLRVTLPKARWGLLYGVILVNARAMGEFGAVSVVSGHIRGETNTLPLHIEILYNEYAFVGAFACSTLLVTLALVTLIAKSIVEARIETAERAARESA